MTETPKTPSTQKRASQEPETVRVALGTRSYDIVIGADLLSQAGVYIAPLLPRPKTVIVTDTNVAKAPLRHPENRLGWRGH